MRIGAHDQKRLGLRSRSLAHHYSSSTNRSLGKRDGKDALKADLVKTSGVERTEPGHHDWFEGSA
ncbi:MAG: hypothetical protein JNK19_16750 [Tabrizicola sp.]|nr:hypothetical protein [Tabrizicola sp.]